jgi:hypothetical protein
MHEIDSQSENPRAEETLAKALRHLASSSPQSASAEIGVGLATAFRRHHTRRRRIRYAGIAWLVACLALMTGVISLHRRQDTSNVAQGHANQTQPAQAPIKQAGPAASNAPAKEPVAAANILPVRASSQPARRRTQQKSATATYSRQFLALPGYDPAVPADELHVVRVRMSTNTLWQMGAPVNPDGIGRRVMADFVVSQDGTPYAVRLVQ